MYRRCRIANLATSPSPSVGRCVAWALRCGSTRHPSLRAWAVEQLARVKLRMPPVVPQGEHQKGASPRQLVPVRWLFNTVDALSS
eukprot:6329809-Amphidinium_carterae.1